MFKLKNSGDGGSTRSPQILETEEFQGLWKLKNSVDCGNLRMLGIVKTQDFRGLWKLRRPGIVETQKIQPGTGQRPARARPGKGQAAQGPGQGARLHSLPIIPNITYCRKNARPSFSPITLRCRSFSGSPFQSQFVYPSPLSHMMNFTQCTSPTLLQY